jgi:heterodisulfide reductase subunit C
MCGRKKKENILVKTLVYWTVQNSHMNLFKDIEQCFSKCGTCTTSGTQEDFKGYATENKLLKIVPETYLLSDEL